MTERELFALTMAHKPHGKIMYDANFIESCEEKCVRELGLAKGTNIREHFGCYFHHDCYPIQAMNGDPGFQFDFMKYYKDIDIKPGSRLDGNGVLHEPGSLFHFTHMVSPLRHAQSLEEILSIPVLDICPGSFEKMKAEVDALHAQGFIAQIWTGPIFETAWQLRDITCFFSDMVDHPDWCIALLHKISRRNVRLAEMAALAGVDMVMTSDDLADQRSLMMGPKFYREMIKPFHKEVCQAARKVNPNVAIWYHSDGNIEEIIPDLVENGVTILNPLQPECVDTERVRKEYGDVLVFDGLIGTQTTMPFDTPQGVRDRVRRVKDQFGQNGGLILSPTHALEPEVPTANVVAFFEACQEE